MFQTLAHNHSDTRKEQALRCLLRKAERHPPAVPALRTPGGDTTEEKWGQASGALCCSALLSHSLRDGTAAGRGDPRMSPMPACALEGQAEHTRACHGNEGPPSETASNTKRRPVLPVSRIQARGAATILTVTSCCERTRD